MTQACAVCIAFINCACEQSTNTARCLLSASKEGFNGNLLPPAQQTTNPPPHYITAWLQPGMCDLPWWGGGLVLGVRGVELIEPRDDDIPVLLAELRLDHDAAKWRVCARLEERPKPARLFTLPDSLGFRAVRLSRAGQNGMMAGEYSDTHTGGNSVSQYRISTH